MARSRPPHASAVAQLVMRLTSLFMCHGCLLITFYILYNFNSSNGLIYFALFWFLIIDNAEILALYSDPRDGIWQIRSWPLLAWEAAGLLFFLGSVFLSFRDDITLNEAGGYVAQVQFNYEIAKWTIIFLIMNTHLALIIVCGLDGFLHRRPRARQDERMW